MGKLLLIGLIGFGAQLIDGALGMAYGVSSRQDDRRRGRPGGDRRGARAAIDLISAFLLARAVVTLRRDGQSATATA